MGLNESCSDVGRPEEAVKVTQLHSEPGQEEGGDGQSTKDDRGAFGAVSVRNMPSQVCVFLGVGSIKGM